MNTHYIFLCVATALLIGCDSTSSEPNLQEQLVQRDYTCEKGRLLSVTYAITAQHSVYANVSLNDATYKLARVPSASGEKYSDGINTWWSKGETGFLKTHKTIVLKNCSINKPIKRMHPSWDTNNDSINDCESDGSCDHTIDYSQPRKT